MFAALVYMPEYAQNQDAARYGAQARVRFSVLYHAAGAPNI